jgi:sterol desaturase/sphingolipid hydroxylase (fatty acid hydroxylase superfamily)
MRLFNLEHSHWAYRADFALYTLAAILMAGFLALASPPTLRLKLLVLAWIGLMCWPLIEYGLHRFVLHGLKPFSTWHAAHHLRPHALICTPTILSATLIGLLVFVPVVAMSDLWQAVALTFGLMAGYLAYAVTHHALHHWRTDNAWLMKRKRCHALHHNPCRPAGFYGVTSSYWDRVLRTDPFTKT